MAKVSTNISIDADTKAKAQSLLAEFGMDLSTAVNIFLKQMVYENAFPISIYRHKSNDTTTSAMSEAEYIRLHPEEYKSYKSVDAMMEDI